MSFPRPRLCATIVADTAAELQARALQSGGDLVELRLDLAGRLDLDEALSGLPMPAIVTYRSTAEGGRFDGSEAERRRLLERAARSPVAYVDLEWTSGFDDLVALRRGRGIILSHHDFAGIPADLDSRVAAMAATPAEIIKVAVTVGRLSDCVMLKDLARRYAGRGLLLIGMGEAGLVTRVCGAHFGAPWVYAGELAGPGQVTVARMRREFRFGSVEADTTLYGLFGRPVGHSLSPAMHNAAMGELGLDAVYVPLAGTDIDDCLHFADAFGVAGASVTAPFKSSVMHRLASWDDEAGRVRAANTIRRETTGWVGTSTDGTGFLSGLGTMTLAGTRVAILGAGGAARSVASALLRQRASVTLYGRDASRTRDAAAAIGADWALRPVPQGCWDLLVNATPVGTHPDGEASAFPEGLYDGQAVYDLVYNPVRTVFLREAEARGCRAIGGLAMLVEQARRQVEWWTGRTPSAGLMRESALWRLQAAA